MWKKAPFWIFCSMLIRKIHQKGICLEQNTAAVKEDKVGQHHKLYPLHRLRMSKLLYRNTYHDTTVLLQLLNNFMLVEFSHLEDKSFFASAKMDGEELPLYPNWGGAQSLTRNLNVNCGVPRLTPSWLYKGEQGNNAWKMRMLIHQRHLGEDEGKNWPHLLRTLIFSLSKLLTSFLMSKTWINWIFYAAILLFFR